MATESHPTSLSADTELVRVHFFVNNISFQKDLLHTGVLLLNSGELLIMEAVSRERTAREREPTYLKF